MAAIAQSMTPYRGRVARRARQLTHQSSMRENVFECLFLGLLGIELLDRGVDFTIYKSSVDKDGLDVLLEAECVQRPIQVKVTIAGGKRSDITVQTKLADRLNGCVLWLIYDPQIKGFREIRWFGNPPGQRMPDPGGRVARHSRANSLGIKADRTGHRVIVASRFERLDDFAHLADKLFGELLADPFQFLRSRLRIDHGADEGWFAEVACGNFATIPASLSWGDEALLLAGLLDGYRLLDIRGRGDPASFLEAQRAQFEQTGRWAGDAADLWATLFLEARASRFAGSDDPILQPRLDQLCQQLRTTLIDLERAHA